MPLCKFISFLVIIMLFTGCSHSKHDSRLEEVYRLASISPHEAIDSLAAIDSTSLSDIDRHFYDLLSVKTADKAYIRHISDSLILSVLNYYSHSNDTLYTESLYYGGRVYSDMGDYPTALRYYQIALDRLSSPSSQQTLKSHVLHQTSGLLNDLRLYTQAIPYVEESIDISLSLNDSSSVMYDYQLLGAINLHLGNYDVSKASFIKARAIADQLSSDEIYAIDIYIAGIKYFQNDIDSALIIIRPAVGKVDSLSRGIALSYASDIYLKSNITDTAYMYAKELIRNKQKFSNAKNGYKVLLSPQLRELIPKDSISTYISEYREFLEQYHNTHDSQEALLQNSFYNYELHNRAREKAEKAKSDLQKVIMAILFIVVFLIAIILYLKNRNQNHLLQLHEALDNLNALRKSMSTDNPIRQTENLISSNNEIVNGCSVIDKPITPNPQDPQQLSLRLKEELLAMQRNSNLTTELSPYILSSEAYSILQTYISQDKIIPDKSTLWNALEAAVISSSKDFKYRLQLLTGGNMKTADYRLAILIKCGVTPTQMSTLVGRTKGTISYRREMLCIRIFGQKLGVKVIDDIIRSL